MKRQRSDAYTSRKRQRRNFKGKFRAAVVAGPRQRAPNATRGYSFPISKGELKFSDTITQLTDVTTAGSFNLLNGIQLGTDATNRIGRKIVVKSIHVRGLVQLENALNTNIAANVVTGGQMARMIIFCDYQPNGAAPAVTDLLVEAVPTSQLNLAGRDRFKILVDKCWAFDPFLISTVATQTFAIMAHTTAQFKKYKAVNIETIYNAGNAGTVADIASGALYVFWIGSFANGVNTNVSANFSRRIRFADP